MEIKVQTVGFNRDGQVIIAGTPVDDGTKFVLATGADPQSALMLAMAVATMEEDVVIDVPEDAVMVVLERPFQP